jgi:hypothetical protein
MICATQKQLTEGPSQFIELPLIECFPRSWIAGDLRTAHLGAIQFKELQVVRFFDCERNVLVYVSYSDRVLEGSPKNSICTVPIMPWPKP